MPNHVQSLLKIRGPESAVAQLVEFVKDGAKVFAFEKIVPPPACILRGDLGEAEEKANPGRNWYEWNVRRWGTKWGAYDQKVLHRADGRVHFGYQSAWTVGQPVIDELAMLFPECLIEHYYIDEGGYGSCNGACTYRPVTETRWGDGRAEGRRTPIKISIPELHVLIHGCEMDQSEETP